MAHILLVTRYYPPEIGAAQTHLSETAACLVQCGHQVTVLTTLPNYPLGIVPPEYRGGARRHEVLDGVSVIRVWSYISPNKGFFRRILAQLSFGCLAGFLGAKAVGQPDLIIVESPPLFNAIAGRILARRKRCPYIFNVQDLWPEAAVQMGVLRNRVAIWLAERLEWSTYQRAAAVWTVTEGLRRTLIQRGLPPEKVFVVPIGADTTLLRPLPKVQARAELGWDDRFVVLYAGTISPSHGLMTLLDTAEQLLDHPDIHFVLVGDGPAKADLMAEAKRRHLKNVTLLGIQPHDRMPLIISGADVCLAPSRKLPVFESALPVKMYEAMACARPVLLATAGEARQLVEQEAGAALYVEPENPAALAKAILYLCDQPDLAERLGQRGRAFVEARFDRNQLTTALEARIAALLEKNQGLHRPSLLSSM